MARKQKPSGLKVHFANTSNPSRTGQSLTTLPFFLTASGIYGLVDTSSLCTTIDSITVKLDGYVSVSIPQRQQSPRGGVGHASVYRHVGRSTITLAHTFDIASAPGISSFPFHFDLTRGQNSHEHPRRFSNVLPPTISFRRVGVWVNSTQAEVTEATSSYTVCVSALINKTVIETIKVPVRIYENSHLQPPAYQGPMIMEFPSQRSTNLRRNLFAKTGIFSAKIPSEPSPLIFTPANDFATTTISLLLAAESENAFSELDASITWRLRTSTIVSHTPMRTCPTAQQARNALSSMTESSSLGLHHRLKMQLRNWARVGSAYSLRQDIVIALPQAALIIPTTHSEHISRHYGMNVEISVRGEDTGRATVSVEIPLQIGYQDTNEAKAPRYQEREGRAPIFKLEEQISHSQGSDGSPPPTYIS